MFFIALCLLLWALFAFNAPFDRFGWLMLVATGWFAGFMDARLYARKDADKVSGTPPGDASDTGDDASIFN